MCDESAEAESWPLTSMTMLMCGVTYSYVESYTPSLYRTNAVFSLHPAFKQRDRCYCCCRPPPCRMPYVCLWMFFFNEIFVLPMAEGLCMFAARYNSGTQAPGRVSSQKEFVIFGRSK